MERPKCPRCQCPLDLVQWDVDGPIGLTCHTRGSAHSAIHMPLQSDESFQEAWDNLLGGDVVRLEKEIRG